METNQTETQASRPSFLKRDENNPALLHCTHKEATGAFVMQKSTFGRELERERIKGVQAGPSPTPDGMILAEWYAALKVGFSQAPDTFDLDNLEDEKLIEALYQEVTAYWASFRDPR